MLVGLVFLREAPYLVPYLVSSDQRFSLSFGAQQLLDGLFVSHRDYIIKWLSHFRISIILQLIPFSRALCLSIA